MSNKANVLTALLLAASLSACNTPKVTAKKAVEPKAPEAKVAVQVDREPVKDKPEESPLSQLKKIHRHNAYFGGRNHSRIVKSLKLPEAADVMCGQFYSLAGKTTKACVTSSKKGGPWESLIIDLNRNNDFNDDKSYAIPLKSKKGSLVIEHGGNEFKFDLSITQNAKSVNLSLTPTECMVGSVSLAGKDRAWMACDCNLSTKLDAGDMAYVDANGNGRQGEHNKDVMTAVDPSAVLYIESKWFGLASEDGENLSLPPYKGKMSSLTIDHSDITDQKAVSHDLQLYLNGGNVVLRGIDPKKGAELPAITIRYFGGAMNVKPTPVRYSSRNLNLKEDVVMTLKKPVANISVSQAKDKINVSQRISSHMGVKFSLARGKPGPAVEVFLEKNLDEPLTKGNMAYG